MIRNKQGIECIRRNYSDEFKNGTKSYVICTKMEFQYLQYVYIQIFMILILLKKQ